MLERGVSISLTQGRQDGCPNVIPLVRYVRHIHSDRYYKQVLIKNPDATFLDIITPSDIAYVCGPHQRMTVGRR
jgi:hypothetical protein